VYAVHEVSDAQPAQSEKSLDRAGLFHALKDREIRRLGVPDDRLSAVRLVCTEEQLEALQSELPDEAYDALYLISYGDKYENVIRERSAT
ncbi:hypothetical protein, partial [Mesorhizobium japonicum]|uniref:hypothetical protein n=1 Tax=Mesorhizobium japonicum TaxID=2066070 RepID=UPI003B5A2FC1